MDVERLEEIKERLEAVTEFLGEWRWNNRCKEIDNLPASGYDDGTVNWYADADGIFVANAKADIEFLLGALVQAYEDGVEYWQAVESWDSGWDDYPEPPYWLQVVQ